MGETEDLTTRARLNREVLNELLETAKRLRIRAEQLAKESDVFAAKAADDYADYLEEAADQWPRLQNKYRKAQPQRSKEPRKP